MPTFLAIIVLLYLALLLALTLSQRKLIYHPERIELNPQAFGLRGFEKLRIAAEDGTQVTVWFSAPGQGMPVIVYFHGNAGHLGMRAYKLNPMQAMGFGVLALSYRGFGDSEGTPSEAGIFSDARAVLGWLNTTHGLPPERVYLYGESLGSGVAVRMATEYKVARVVLEAPYTSVADRAAELYPYVPVKLLLRDRFDSISRIASIHAPLLLFHGRKDTVIPAAHGEALLAAAKEPKKGIFYDEVDHTGFDPQEIARQIAAFMP